ncbi:hypothetical protein HMN09_00200700 [Mycena chlorophos]|uniref:ABC transmembrane type-1 domain-containing protein n=1 Tax=Mycena chlorophos TaxID=658473 RepID=A0A8H6TQR7_MYCCL|nr:hypothetical protein HMN09_00200700 [Mycena chlorophos]
MPDFSFKENASPILTALVLAGLPFALISTDSSSQSTAQVEHIHATLARLDAFRLLSCIPLVFFSLRQRSISTQSIPFLISAVLCAITVFSSAKSRASLRKYATLSLFLGFVIDLRAFQAGVEPPVERIALAALLAIVVPLASPRIYSPADPKNPSAVPNPEQTASILSLAFYSFLDPTVFLGKRLKQIPYDSLPPLADYDSAKYLKESCFKFFKPDEHLVFGILRAFRWDIATLVATSVVIVLSKFAAPMGLRRLLRFLESTSRTSSSNVSTSGPLEPWIWVFWLFAGPALLTLADNWYMFLVSRTTHHLETVLTQLIFEHALRMRINGRLNNMITHDVRAIVMGKRLLLSLVYQPLMFGLSVWFLYGSLGWSAFVGMAATIVLLPVPGYTGKR